MQKRTTAPDSADSIAQRLAISGFERFETRGEIDLKTKKSETRNILILYKYSNLLLVTYFEVL